MRLVIFYRTSHGHSGHHHNPYKTGGLAANALHSMGVLRKMGVNADIQPVKDFSQLWDFMDQNRDVTHAVVEAVWLKASEVFLLSGAFPKTEFVVRAHSKIGFLQVEPEAVPIVRDIISLSERVKNVRFSSNNEEFCRALGEVYGPVLYLPNLYDLDESLPRDRSCRDVVRIASFGASRLLKLHPNAALAALQVARRLGKKLEFFINTDSTPGSESVRNTVKNLLKDLSWAKLILVPWQDSVTFKATIASMDLVYQLSCTETFCLVAADAVASGVPAIVGPAVTWLPERYQVEIDDTSHAADIGVEAIQNESCTVSRQQRDLEEFVKSSKEVWSKFLDLHPKRHRKMWIF